MFKRISNLIRGFLGLFISGMERQNPEALLEVEKENLRVQISRYNQGLASHAALCERLMTQVKKLEPRSANSAPKRRQPEAGQPRGSRPVCAALAVDQQPVGENRKQLEGAEDTYRDLTQARNVTVDAAKRKSRQLKYSIDDMKIKKATAEMTEMASGMIGAMGGSGETLNRLHEMVEEEREKAAGRARVAKDSLNTTEFEMKEAEEKALADQALADFAAAEGIAISNPPFPPTPPPNRPPKRWAQRLKQRSTSPVASRQ